MSTAVVPDDGDGFRQLLTYHLSVAEGLDPDRPRGLTNVILTY